MALYIFSDAHLGSASPEKERQKVEKIRALFDLVETDGDRLVILGDLFDFWFEYKHAVPKEHQPVLFMLHDLIRKGIKVDYVSGNHDFWMNNFFESQMGLEIHRDCLNLEYEGLRLHLIHGDGLAPGDWGYRRLLKPILRNRVNIWLYRWLHPDIGIPLAKLCSGSSRELTARREHTFAVDYEAYAEKKLSDGFDVVAIGHLHLPTQRQFDSGIYINTGDFIHHFTYARLADGRIMLENLAG